MKATLAVAMIVRNESEGIERCLASVKPYISSATVIDTGSTDDTMNLVRKALDGIDELILPERPWVDFGHNRSELMEAARGSADWLILSDADMEWEIDPSFEPDPSVDAYGVLLGDPHGFSWRLPLLVRGDLEWRFREPVHAYLDLDRPYKTVPTDAVRMTMFGSRTSDAKTQGQYDALKAALDNAPDDPRKTFYLAQTARELGRDDEARALYYRRATMGGFAEEAYYAQFRGALLEPEWPQRMAGLIAAYEMRPTRLEAVYELAKQLSARGQRHAADRWATVPIEPTNDLLFVHRDVLDWGLMFERSITSYWCGRYAESKALSEELLDNPRLPANVREQVIVNLGYATARLTT